MYEILHGLFDRMHLKDQLCKICLVSSHLSAEKNNGHARKEGHFALVTSHSRSALFTRNV